MMRARIPGGRCRRGAVGLASVIALVFMQLLIVGAIITGTRDQNISVQRLDSTRAFYASESGASMAIRECELGIDEDGDGAVGTISDDGNPNNDPQLGTARFVVTSSTSGGVSTLAPSGRFGSCRRLTNAVISGGSGATTPGNKKVLCGIARNAQKSPRYSVWSGSAWGTNTAMPFSVLGNVMSVSVSPCTKRNEIMAGIIDSQNDYSVSFFNGSSWGGVTRVGTNIARDGDRPAQVSYEQRSGDGMVVYWDDVTGEFAYRTWNGSTLSAQALMTASSSNHSHFIGLYPKPNSDEVICLCNDHVNANTIRLLAKVWTGSSWTSWTVLTTSLAKFDRECFAAGYETVSGTGLVVYGEGGQTQPRYRTWNGSSWSAELTLPSIGKNPYWVRLASDPASDQIICAMSDQDWDVEVNVWSGTAWGTNMQFTSNQGADQPRLFDVAWEPGGTGQAVLFYRNNAKQYPVYRTFDGSTWSIEMNGPNINRHAQYLNAVPGFSAGELFLCVCDTLSDVHLFRWNGASLSSDTDIETSISVTGQEPANLAAAPALGNRPKVQAWAEVQP